MSEYLEAVLKKYLEAALRRPRQVLVIERVTAPWPAAARLRWTEGRRSLLGLTWRNRARRDVKLEGSY